MHRSARICPASAASFDLDDTERATPFHARAIDTARALAELALERAARGDHDTARNAIADALVILDAAEDRSAAARVTAVVGEALLGIARSLAMLGDPAARAAYEDAGHLYEDLGDEPTVRSIDRELRAIEAVIEESPRSFQSSPRITIRNET